MDLCLSEQQISDFVAGHLDGEERAAVEAHLDRCGGCLSVVARMASLLIRESRLGAGALEDTQVAATLPAPATRLQPGQTAGRYRIVGVLGAGGMGAVYLADDPALDRKVAIKVLKGGQAGAATNALRTRLLREAHAMARLQHANVVTVYDVGLLGQEVFVVMEHVDGMTLREWLKQPRTVEEIVEVATQSARGLEAAHLAGLVHRDFKPDNVLISGERVRVSDFGLASPLDPNHPHRDEDGVLAGTPAYMPPEQLAGAEVGVPADVFSFGVTLFEALHGQRPFAGDSFQQLKDNVTAGRIRPGKRRLPRWLADLLPSLLAVDPTARPPSMAAVIARLERGRRRRRSWVWASAAAAVALSSTVGATLVRNRLACRGAERKLVGVWDSSRKQAVHAAFTASKSPLADASFAIVEKTLDGWTRAWVDAHQSACEATSVHHEQSVELLDLRMACLNERLDEVRAFVNVLATADGDVVRDAPGGAAGLGHVDDCSDVASLTAPIRPPRDPAARVKLAAVRSRLAEARAQKLAGRFDDANAAALDAVKQAKAIDYLPAEAETESVLAQVALEQNRFPEAEQAFEAAVELADRGRDDLVRAQAARELVHLFAFEQKLDEGRRWARNAQAIVARLGRNEDEQAALSMNIGLLAQAEGKFDEAEREIRRSLTIREHAQPYWPAEVALTVENLASVLDDEGKYDESATAHRRALSMLTAAFGPQHPNVATAMDNLGSALLDQNHAKEALDSFQQALKIRRAVFPAGHRLIAMSLINVGAALSAVAEWQHAIDTLEEARPLVRNTPGDFEATIDMNESQAYAALGRSDRAIELAKDALALRERELGHDHPAVGRANVAVADRLIDGSDWKEARPYLERAQQLLEKALGSDHDQLADVHNGLGRWLERARRWREAISEYERALAIRTKAEGETSIGLLPLLCGLGRAALESGDAPRAVAILERAHALAGGGDASNTDRADADFPLARALVAAHGSRARALQLANAALAAYEAARPPRREATEVRAWLRVQKAGSAD